MALSAKIGISYAREANTCLAATRKIDVAVKVLGKFWKKILKI